LLQRATSHGLMIATAIAIMLSTSCVVVISGASES
jgi:hypothetical protein